MKRRTGRGLIGFFSQHNERGASLVEYSLLVSLIAVVCIGAVRDVGSKAKQAEGVAAACMGATAAEQVGCGHCLVGRNTVACQTFLATYLP